MTRQTHQHQVALYRTIVSLLIVLSALVDPLPGAPPEEQKDKSAPAAKAKAEEQIRAATEKLVRDIDLEILRNDKWTKVDRIEKPLLFFTDPTRLEARGAIWGWGRKGRPAALLELWYNLPDRRWHFTICNTSAGKLRAHLAGAPWWRKNVSAAELKDIPGAPAPSAEAAVRQRQLKMLAEKFSGHEIFEPDKTKYDLRLLKRPLCTYRDEANGLLEGGLFTLANGTNPEIMFFVEARLDPKDRWKSAWQFTAGRQTHAEFHLEYNGKEVFAVPNGDKVAGADQPYWTNSVRIALDAGLPKP